MPIYLGHLDHTNSPDILRRQKRVLELRAEGLTAREIALELECSLHVVQTLITRSSDQRVSFLGSEWADGLPHNTARALLKQGYKSRDEIAQGILSGELTKDLPGLSERAMQTLAQWLGDEGSA